MEGSNDAGVRPLVISFCNSSNVNPTESRAATLAIGKPVALDANADDLLTLGFISMTTTLPFSGLMPN